MGMVRLWVWCDCARGYLPVCMARLLVSCGATSTVGMVRLLIVWCDYPRVWCDCWYGATVGMVGFAIAAPTCAKRARTRQARARSTLKPDPIPNVIAMDGEHLV